MPGFLFPVLVPKFDSQMPIVLPLWLLRQPIYFPFQYQYPLFDVLYSAKWQL